MPWAPAALWPIIGAVDDSEADGGQDRHGESDRLAALERENEALRRGVRLLHQIANLVRESLELEPTGYGVLTGVTAGVGLGINRAMLFLADAAERGTLRGAGAVGPTDLEEADQVWRSIEADAPDLETLYEAGLHQRDHPGPLDRRVRATAVPVDGDSPVSLALRRGEAVIAEGTDDLGGLLHVPTSIAAPMRARDGVAGVLYADNRFTGRRLDPVTQLLFAMVADHAGRAIESARRYERVARQARTDALTGLGHHGAMRAAIAEAVHRARSTGRPLGLAMVDLDDFKAVNDQLGHLAGDALLAAVAERLRTNARVTDTPFRYGGEEFAVLVPDAEPAELAAVAERLRASLADRPFEVGREHALWVTCSVGVASLDEAHDDPESLIAAADDALLRAKAAGKNRVERARP